MRTALDIIGNTPTVELRNLFRGAHFEACAKLELLNVGGSIKDRAAREILVDALATGRIDRNTVIVESSSGNMAVGLAQVTTMLGLRLICVVDPNASQTNVAIVRALGATVDVVTEPDPDTGDFLTARISRVQHHLAALPNAYWPNQYKNPLNGRAHWKTMAEMVRDLGRAPDFVICAVSSCGTLRGCAEYAAQSGLKTKFIAVDAVGSLISGHTRGRRLIPGHGAGMRPGLFRPDFVHRFVRVSDLDCVLGCRRVAASEGLLVGGSSGGVAVAMERLRFQFPRGALCVALFPDRGERYLSTVFSDAWVERSFGKTALDILEREGKRNARSHGDECQRRFDAPPGP